MQIDRIDAVAGKSGANVDASTLISVLAAQIGAPAGNLVGPPGTNYGTQTSEISMPTVWSLIDGFNGDRSVVP
jgi:hypothetical protein